MQLWFIFFHTNAKLEKFDLTCLPLFRLFLSLFFGLLISGMWSRFLVDSLGMSQFISSNLLTCSRSLFKYSVKLRSEFHCLRNVGRNVVRNVTSIRRLDGAILTWTFRYFLTFVSISVLLFDNLVCILNQRN